MRRVGAAAVAVAGLVLVAGCGSEGGGADAKPSRPSHLPAPVPTETVAETPEPMFPDTPAGRLDAKAHQQGWEVDSLYPAPSDYVDDICESMPEQKKIGTDPGEWLMTAQEPNQDETDVLRAGMPTLVKGDLDGCYWERSTRAGEIIDNNFASAAREITVTIRASDGLFKAEGCGTWSPVG
jgi:hypothetical protein